MREVGRREEELALEGGRWWREALDVGLWDALEAGRTGRTVLVLGIDRRVQVQEAPATSTYYESQ
jgi:hypothetical protein